jgi:hypothetical protein
MPLTPHIASINPNIGPIGTHVLLGGGFVGVTGANVNSIPATILSNSGSSMIIVVPAGASTGLIRVNAGEQVSNGILFTVTGPLVPGITSLTPASGNAGTSVVIGGGNFGASQGTSTVTFNGVAAGVVSWSNTSITAIVPAMANTGPVIVSTSAGASNSMTFTVTNASNGGMSIPLNLFLIPAENFSGLSVIWTFDTTDFNDIAFGSFYSWKVEDVLAGRTPTISRVIISYRDLGVATLTATLTGTDDAANVITSTQDIQIGTVAASGRICSQLVGIALTGQNLQLSVERLANGGPVSITKVRMEGRVEMTVY